MKILLKYSRLEKPRGSWWYGLKWSLEVLYTDQEKTNLTPDWQASGEFILSETSTRPNGDVGSNDWYATAEMQCFRVPHHKWLITPIGTQEGRYAQTYYFRYKEGRELFIQQLHVMRDAAVAAHEKWWAETAPVPAEPEQVFLSILEEDAKTIHLENAAATVADRLTT